MKKKIDIITQQREELRRKNSETEKQLISEEMNSQRLLRKKLETEQSLSREQEKSNYLSNKLSSIKCVICGELSNGKHYCYNCYTKFKNQSVDIRISKCSDVKIIDYFGNKEYKCQDGRMVRSRAERDIADFLYSSKIRYIYEKPIYYVENKINKTLHPDFYLPDYNLFIEYNELNTEEYMQKKSYAMDIYKKKGLNVVVMTNNDIFNTEAFIVPILNKLNQ